MTSMLAPLPIVAQLNILRSPLSASTTPASSLPNLTLPLPVSPSPAPSRPRSPLSPAPPESPSTYQRTAGEPPPRQKDLRFLLDPSIYHPLSQLDTPPPLRESPPYFSPETSLASLLSQLETLLAKGSFVSAAQLAVAILTSSLIDSTDAKTIFDLLAVRYSCLELTGNTLLAAQEAKALEDLNSSFYYLEPLSVSAASEKQQGELPVEQHIVPFSLRLEALRLQSIGFSDPRRGVSALFDLGLECRENIDSSFTSIDDRTLWGNRLDEIGIRVVNALVEMGDLDCARRTLSSLKPTKKVKQPEWCLRMALLCLRIGEISTANQILQESSETALRASLSPLVAIAEGRYESAASEWEKQLEENTEGEASTLIKHNLAISYLYSGHIDRARETLEGLIGGGQSFQSLTFNLATLYELSSDKSRDLKLTLVDRVAETGSGARAKANINFKL